MWTYKAWRRSCQSQPDFPTISLLLFCSALPSSAAGTEFAKRIAMNFVVVPPPHVSHSLFASTERLFHVGGMLWMAAYCVLIRQSWKQRTYGVPLASLAHSWRGKCGADRHPARPGVQRCTRRRWSHHVRSEHIRPRRLFYMVPPQPRDRFRHPTQRTARMVSRPAHPTPPKPTFRSTSSRHRNLAVRIATLVCQLSYWCPSRRQSTWNGGLERVVILELGDHARII